MKRIPLFFFLTLASLALAGPISVESGGSSKLPGINVGNDTFVVTPGTTFIDGGLALSAALSVANGGTGLTAGGTSGQVLTADVNAPVWGIAGIVGGGTNTATPPIDGGIVYGASLGYASTVQGTTGQCLKSAGANAPTWGLCNAAAEKASGSATVDIASTASGACAADFSITTTGGTMVAKWVCSVAPPFSTLGGVAGLQLTAWPSDNTIATVRPCCNGAASCDPLSIEYNVVCIAP